MSTVIGRFLAKRIWKLLPPKRPPDFNIGPEEDPYMRRWWVIPRNRFFNIYLHHMRHDDDDRAPHDHPWWSLSLCLKGHIRENQLVHIPPIGRSFLVNEINEGDFKWRNSTYAHWLQLPHGDAWTLFITGPKIRIWGFHCPNRWVPWEEFGEGGCGEE